MALADHVVLGNELTRQWKTTNSDYGSFYRTVYPIVKVQKVENPLCQLECERLRKELEDCRLELERLKQPTSREIVVPIEAAAPAGESTLVEAPTFQRYEAASSTAAEAGTLAPGSRLTTPKTGPGSRPATPRPVAGTPMSAVNVKVNPRSVIGPPVVERKGVPAIRPPLKKAVKPVRPGLARPAGLPSRPNKRVFVEATGDSPPRRPSGTKPPPYTAAVTVTEPPPLQDRPKTSRYDYYKNYGYAGHGAKTSWAHNYPLGEAPPAKAAA